MKRDIFILDCHEIKCTLPVKYAYDDLCGAFRRKKYNVRIVDNVFELHNNSIVFMGNIFHCNEFEPQDLLNEIAPDAIYIGWYWTNVNVNKLKYFIHTYENIMNIYYDETKPGLGMVLEKPSGLIKLRQQKYNVPLLLRANDDPMLIGTYERKIERDYCYMGYKYCPHMVPINFTGVYYGTLVHENFMSYEERKKIYLSSTFSLGFQSRTNIELKHVSQRIYEGMAYGCVVLSNSLAACQQTNNIVIYVNSLEDLEEKMAYYKNNPELIKQKQQQGYEFVKKHGTNEKSIELISKVIQRFSS